MGTPKIIGTNAPLFQFWEQRFSPTQGVHTHQEFEGLDVVQMSALAQEYVNAGYSGTLKYEKNVATLVLDAGNTSINGSYSSPAQNIVDKWEVAVDQDKPELFENQNFINLFYSRGLESAYGAPISQQVAQAIRQTATSENPTWKNLVQLFGNTNVVNANGDEVSPAISLANIIGNNSLFQAIKYFADDYFRGATNFVHGKYSLRHTTSAPNNYNLNVADFNVENIYSIATLLSECQSTTLWILPLPGYLAYKILAYPVPVAVPPNYAFGGLKMRSNAITAARNRIEITTEYLIDAWPRHTYGSYV